MIYVKANPFYQAKKFLVHCSKCNDLEERTMPTRKATCLNCKKKRLKNAYEKTKIQKK